MHDFFFSPLAFFEAAATLTNKSLMAAPRVAEAAFRQTQAVQTYWAGIFSHFNSFMEPSLHALNSFLTAERAKLSQKSPEENVMDYTDLLTTSLKLASRSLTGALKAMGDFSYRHWHQGATAWVDVLTREGASDVLDIAMRQENLTDMAVRAYPKAAQDIRAEYGFDFDGLGYARAGGTERFDLYQVLPREKNVNVLEDCKPILIIGPCVLSPHILAFLPGEKRSYVHCFADQGIPTYVRIVKDIATTPAVQLMTGEDDALDTMSFCEQLKLKHGRPVTLNGFWHGGYLALLALLSGKLDGLVDAFITCSTSIDGSRSKSLQEYLMSLPPRFRDISYSVKALPNGIRVLDGKVAAWVYRLQKLQDESPVATFHRDLDLLECQKGPTAIISKAAAALNHWLSNDHSDIPLALARLCFESYTTHIEKDGSLPVMLFGRKLNLSHLKEMGIPWLICIAAEDDLVSREASLAALEHVEATVSVFPRSDVAIAGSWSIPTSECALHLRSDRPSVEHGLADAVSEYSFQGPVRFHLDLDEAKKQAALESLVASAATDEDTPTVVAPLDEEPEAVLLQSSSEEQSAPLLEGLEELQAVEPDETQLQQEPEEPEVDVEDQKVVSSEAMALDPDLGTKEPQAVKKAPGMAGSRPKPKARSSRIKGKSGSAGKKAAPGK